MTASLNAVAKKRPFFLPRHKKKPFLSAEKRGLAICWLELEAPIFLARGIFIDLSFSAAVFLHGLSPVSSLARLHTAAEVLKRARKRPATFKPNITTIASHIEARSVRAKNLFELNWRHDTSKIFRFSVPY